MDSDTKKFGHVRVRLGIPRIESDHTVLATVLPIENLPLARVLIRVRNRPLQVRHRNRPRLKTNESLACGLSKNAGLRIGSKTDICSAREHVRFTPESGRVRRTGRCPLRVKNGLMQRVHVRLSVDRPTVNSQKWYH